MLDIAVNQYDEVRTEWIIVMEGAFKPFFASRFQLDNHLHDVINRVGGEELRACYDLLSCWIESRV